MTYNVSGGTLNLALSIYLHHQVFPLVSSKGILQGGRLLHYILKHVGQVVDTGFPLYFGVKIQGLFKDFQGP